MRRTRPKALRLEALEAKWLLAADGADLVRDTFEVHQNAIVQSLNVLGNDRFDEDYAGEKRITDVSLGSLGGRIGIAADGNSISYAPPADASGTESFTYFVDDGFSATVSIRIVVPLRADSYRLVPDQPSYTLAVMDNDAFWKDYEGDRKITLVSASTIGANVTIGQDGKSLSYTRREHTYGADTLTYIVDQRYPANVTVEMLDPLRDDQFQMVQFDPPQTINVTADDPFWSGYQGARQITHVLDVPAGAAAEITNNGRSIRFSLMELGYGSYSMRYVVDGQYEASISARVHRPVNDDFFTVDKNSERFRVDLLRNDNYRSIFDYRQVIDVIDRITSVSVSEQGATISVTPDGQGVFYTPPPEFNGDDSFTYLADGKHEAKVRVSVRDPLDSTFQRNDYFSLFQGTVNNPLPVLNNDFFGDGYQGARVITNVSEVEGATVQIAAEGKSLLFTPGGEQNYYTFTYDVDNAFTANVGVSIRSIAVHETFWFSSPVESTLRILDRVEFPSTYVGNRVITEVGQPDSGGSVSISENGRSLKYKPGIGAESFDYTIDGKYTGTIRIAYRQRLNYDYHVAHQNSDVQRIDVLANDFDSYSESRWGRYAGPRTITHVESISGNGFVSIAADGKSISFEPQKDFVGTEQVRYVVDGFLEASVSIDVARLLRHDRLHVDPGTAANLNVLENDLVGGDYTGPLLITGVTEGKADAEITVAADGKSIVYTPAPGFTGQDIFEYTVDGRLKANVVVEVNPSVAELYPKFESLDAFKQLVLENTKLGRDSGGFGGGDFLSDGVAPESVKRDHSETNVQVEGVDEADLIETDSDYLYTLTQGQLVITQAWPADQLQVLSRTDIPGAAIGQYLHGDRLAVISQEQSFVFFDGIGRVDGLVGGDLIWPYPVPDPQTYITVLDVSNRAEPKLVQRTEIEGSHVQTRRIDDYVYLVVRDSESLIPQRQQICEGEGDEQVCRTETDEERLHRIENDFASVAEDLLPNYESFGPDGKLARAGLLINPEDMFDPISEGASSLISVVAVDISNSEPGLASSTGVLTTGASQLYVTTNSLYVFEEHYSWSSTSPLDDSPTTKILKFELARKTGGVQFAATGQIPGRMLNQFSADESDQHLRIATTINNSRSGNYSGGQENALFVLRDDGGVLEHVGTIQNLALNETIQSVRFFGGRAMMTTFQAIDPLFSINLTDHENPFVEGHLTLPGFASYMQFVDSDHLLTIGRSTAIGWGGAVAISLFDVSNILQPLLIDQFNWEHFAHSPASTDHHAFGWFPNHKTLAIPSQTSYSLRTDQDGDGYKEHAEWITDYQLHAFGINTSPRSRDDSGIVVNGTIALDSAPLRSAYIADKLYAVATKSIKSVEISNPNIVLDEVDISRPDDEVEEPVDDPRLPLIGQLRQEARADLSSALHVRPAEIMLVATEANAGQTKMLLRVADDHFVYHGLGDQLERRRLNYEFQNAGATLPFDWHNDENPLDTNGDGVVSPLDALLVIRAINDGLTGVLPTSRVVNQIDPIVAQFMIDTNGDGYASPIDALKVIAHINANSPHSQTTVEPKAVDAVLASAFAVADTGDDEERSLL